MKKYDGPASAILMSLISIDRSADTPVYLQIAKALVQGIRRGQVLKGAKLPGTAVLAAALGINRKTLQASYDELMAQGWIDILPRKGAFVATELPEIAPRPLGSSDPADSHPTATSFPLREELDARLPEPASLNPRNLVLDGGLPDVRLAPLAELIREYRNLARRKTFTKYLKYGNPAGADNLIEALLGFLRETRGLRVARENLMITRGAQMAFYLSARLLVRPGDHVAVGFPGYAIIEVMLRQIGAVIDRVPVDASGMDTEFLESICRRNAPKIVYVLPHHHYPTNATLTPERRIRLLELAIRHKFAILEDDFDYDFEYESGPFLPIASLDDHGSVIYVGTLAKTTFPSMRVGFLAAPSSFVRTALQSRRSIDLQGDSMMETAIAELYRNGTMKAHIRKAVKLYRERRDHMCGLLHDQLGNRISFDVPTGGMGIWANFAGVDLDGVAQIAYRKGLTIGDRLIFNPGTGRAGTERSHWARLGFASLNPSEQTRAIGILKDSVAEATRSEVGPRGERSAD